jgi:hypothetical protein
MEINCNICNKKVEHTEVYYDEEGDKFICLSCQEERVKKLLEATPERLLFLIRLCHPKEKGEPYSRYEVIDEIRNRGPDSILTGLGWPYEDGSIYKNRYTGDEETIKEICGNVAWEEAKTLDYELPFLMENWSPKDIWTNEELLNDYKRNPKITDFFGKAK